MKKIKKYVLTALTVASVAILAGLDVEMCNSVVVPVLLYIMSAVWLVMFSIANESRSRK